MRFEVAASLLCAGLLTSSVFAGGGQTWPFDLTTTGNPVNFVSPTAVDPNADEYEGTFTISQVFVSGVAFGFVQVGPLDVTDQIPPEFLSGTGTVAGPAPVTIFNETVVAPEPPEAPAVAATIAVGLNAQGFGTLSATNITLGTYQATVPPFGTVAVQLTSIRIIGTVTVNPNTTSTPGDLNGDSSVNGVDLGILLSQWLTRGSADLNGDGVVNGIDLGILLANWTF